MKAVYITKIAVKNHYTFDSIIVDIYPYSNTVLCETNHACAGCCIPCEGPTSLLTVELHSPQLLLLSMIPLQLSMCSDFEVFTTIEKCVPR